MFPGKGTSLDEKEKDEALTELLMDLTWADHVTPEELAKMYSQLEYEFGFMLFGIQVKTISVRKESTKNP